MKELIKWLKQEGFFEQAYSLRKGATTLDFEIRGVFSREENLGDSGAKVVAQLLKTNTTLTALSFGKNKIEYAGAAEIAGLLKTNINITKLSLEKNNIRNAGAKFIAELLKTNTSLTVLSLGDNKIGQAGAKDLAELLKTNISLTALSLGDNKIGDTGARDIAKALKTNTTLACLDLGSNKIGELGVKALALVLKTNTTLIALDLSSVIEDVGKTEIAEALTINNTLINFNYTSSDSVGGEIEKRICYNNELVKKLSLLLSHYFLKEEVSKENMNVDYAFKVLTANKFYKVVNKQLLKARLQEQGINEVESKLKKVDELIKMKPFTIVGVCKNIQPDIGIAADEKHISHLPTEIMDNILAYVGDTPWGWKVVAIGNTVEPAG